MYINEPADPSPLYLSPSMKAVVYAGLAGTLILGIYPKPFIDWAVAATLFFSNIGAPVATVPSSVLPFGG
jgi:NADH-quinone oxidoreductase subunit N